MGEEVACAIRVRRVGATVAVDFFNTGLSLGEINLGIDILKNKLLQGQTAKKIDNFEPRKIS